MNYTIEKSVDLFETFIFKCCTKFDNLFMNTKTPMHCIGVLLLNFKGENYIGN